MEEGEVAHGFARMEDCGMFAVGCWLDSGNGGFAIFSIWLSG